MTDSSGLLRKVRAAYWEALGETERAAAKPSPESLVGWHAAVTTVLDLVDAAEIEAALRECET